MNRIEIVVEKYNSIITDMPDKRKYYHLNSLNNFLQHYGEIKSENDRESVLQLMDEYTSFIFDNYITSMKECKKMFNEYIYPIGRYYKTYANFSFVFQPSSVVFLFLTLDIFLYIFSASKFLLISINIMGLIILISMFIKRKSSRVFGVNW